MSIEENSADSCDPRKIKERVLPGKEVQEEEQEVEKVPRKE
jgi:hypothetical protein